MEVKIGVQNAAREMVLESSQTPDEIAAAVQAAVAAGGLLTLEDVKGHRILVPADRLAYVEIGTSASRRVGFGAA